MAIKLNTGTAGAPQTFQPGASFSDQQKQELANSVGFSGEYDPKMFNKEFDPSTGQNKLYIKVGASKVFGAQPQAKQAGVQDQASYMQQQFGARSMDDIYSSILAARPSDTDLQVALGKQTGLSDQIAGARTQMDDIQRKMLGDQSAIFNATNPDGTPVDPRVKVAQYQQNMQSYMNRIDQLGKLESTYKAELQTLSEAEKSRIEAENKRNLTALQYLKDMNEQKRQAEQSALQKDQFAFQKEQFQYGKQKDLIDFNQAKELAQFNASLDPDKYTKWQEIERVATENSSLADLYGKNVGTYTGNRGYDLAGKMGDAIVAPPGARVVETRRVNGNGGVDVEREGQGGQSMKDVGYGNSVVLQLPDGKYMRLSHLNSIDVPLGSDLAGGQLVGTRGNTGNVLGRNGEKLTAEQLAAGRGAHVDVEISNDASFGKNSLLSNEQQIAYLKSVKPFATQKASSGNLADDPDLRTARISTAIYGKTASEGEGKRIAKIIAGNPNATDNDIMDAATGFTYPPQYSTVAGNMRSILTQSGVEKLDTKLPGIGRQLQEGNIPAAVRSVENYALSQINKDNLGNDKIREDKVKVAITLAKDLQALLESGKQAVGPIDGTVEEWLGRFKSPEAQTISRKIRELTGKMRNELSGTAVTASESAFLNPIIPELYDTEANMMDKIQGLRRNPINEYNQLRSLGGLPKLNETSLFDITQRANQYDNKGVTLPAQNQRVILDSIKNGVDPNAYIQDLQSKGYDTSFIGGNQYNQSSGASQGSTLPVGVWQQQNKGRIIK